MKKIFIFIFRSRWSYYRICGKTASIISFLDQVFDSINGSTFEADHGKIIRCAIKPGSPHLVFWKNAISVLKSMKFCYLKK